MWGGTDDVAIGLGQSGGGRFGAHALSEREGGTCAEEGRRIANHDRAFGG